jgi:hypothetical protein
MDENPQSAPQTESAKKPYVPPCLIEYGSVEKLTHAGTGGAMDATMPMP